MRRVYAFLLLLISLTITPQLLQAAERTYNVLFLQSYSCYSVGHKELTRGLLRGFEKGGVKINLSVEYLNADHWTYEQERFLLRRVSERARRRGTDLIVTHGDQAFYSLVTCGDSLAYKVPLVMTGVRYAAHDFLKKMPNVSGFIVEPDFDQLIRESIRVFPDRDKLICLSDSSFLSQEGTKKIRAVWDVLQPEYPGYSMSFVNAQSSSMNFVISSLCYVENARSRSVIVPAGISFMAMKFKAPIFGTHCMGVSAGAFCVHDLDLETDAYGAGVHAAAVLKGKKPAELGITNKSGGFLYDFKQMEFFKVSKDRLPKNAIVLNEPLMSRYGELIISCYVIVIVLLVAVVVWLVRRNRQESKRRIQAQTRLMVQQQLVEQRDEYDNIISSIQDGLAVYDTDLRIRFFNKSLMDMLHEQSGMVYDKNDFVGKEVGSLYHLYSNGVDILRKLIGQVIAEGKSIPFPPKTFMVEVNSNVYFPVSGEVIPIFTQDKLSSVAMVCRNITQEELRNRLYNLAVENGKVFPWQFDMRKMIFVFPDGIMDLFNVSHASLTREDVQSFVHPDDSLGLHEYFGSILVDRERADTSYHFRLRNADGTYHWWEISSTAYDGLTADAPYMVMGILQNIQAHKTSEKELIEARDRALEADKLKSAFLANMSHEIRTPLNSIVGFSDLLKDMDSFSHEEVATFVETINTNCGLLLTLISDILDMSRIESNSMDFQFASYNMTYVMQEVYDSQCFSMPEGVKLIVKCPGADKATILRTDVVRIKQVINNFINNAKKFTKVGSITLGYGEQEPGYTNIFVEDTGCGMSPESVKHIFERFYKVNNFTQGAGLGLSICKTIVDRLQGVIRVTSQEGKGTRFEVRLPHEMKEI